MHQPIKDGLESYLAGKAALPDTFTAHLQTCNECAAEVETMNGQARMFRALRASAEPRAGFYGRVLDRIERQVPPSIWSIMLEPAFGRRIAVACATLTIVLGAYLVSTEPGDQSSRTPAAVVDTRDVAQRDNGVIQPQDRDAVLVSLASFREN